MGRSSNEEPEFVRLAKAADVLIKGAIVACSILLVYGVNSYGWRPDRYFTSPLSGGLYYGLAALVGVLIASLRLANRYRIGVSIFLVSAACSMYAGELCLVWFGDDVRQTRRAATLAAAMGVKFDVRDRVEVLADLARQGLPAVPNINPTNVVRTESNGTLVSEIRIGGVETLPLGGIANRRTVYCNESGQYVIYESDEHGFNNPKDMWSAERIDVAAVGDSFTQGSCVPSDKNVIGVMRTHYPASVNLGMVNDGPLTELATLKEYVSALKPNIVLWFYCESNDLEDLVREKRTPLLMSYLTGDFTQGLLKEQAAIDDALDAYVRGYRSARPHVTGGNVGAVIEGLKPIVKLEGVRERVGLAYAGHRRDPELAVNMALFEQILREAKTVSDKWGGRLYFVYLPEWLRYAIPRTASKDRDAVLTVVRSAGIPVIDMHPVFQADGDPLRLFPFRTMGGHYNEEGYKVVAEEVLRSISLTAPRSN